MNAKERKERPVGTGVLDYFPDALLAVAHCSYVGNEQHNPGQPLHWAREKSTDEADALIRHFMERGTFDDDGVRHSAKVAWRALALLQKEIENDRERDYQAVIEYYRAIDPERARCCAGEADAGPCLCGEGGQCTGASK